MKPGLDLLGMAHRRFPLKRLLKNVDRDIPIGWFWSHFGNSVPKFKWMLDQGFHIFRPQIFWDDNHRTVPLKTLEKSLNELNKVVSGYQGQITLYVSPSCEHREKNVSAMRQRLKMVEDIIPWAIPVNCPEKGRGITVPGYLTEYHGANPGKCDLASTDGTNIYDIDARKWVENYCYKKHPAFLWGHRFNLREIGDPGQKPPKVADRRAAPNQKYFNSILRLGQPFGEAPAPKFDAKPFRSPNIWKTHAEDDQEPNESTPDEPRENRPVLIIKPNVRTVEILNRDGKVIGKLPRYGSFEGGLSRYYSGTPGGVGLYGYEIGAKAKRTSGSEFVWFRAGKTVLGPINPAFRAGTFRD